MHDAAERHEYAGLAGLRDITEALRNTANLALAERKD